MQRDQQQEPQQQADRRCDDSPTCGTGKVGQQRAAIGQQSSRLAPPRTPTLQDPAELYDHAERLRQLRVFLLAGSSIDGTVLPPESQMFGFPSCDADGYGDPDDITAKGRNGDAANLSVGSRFDMR